MRQTLILLIFLATSLIASAQKRHGYEYRNDIPVYIDSIQARLTYPLAWRNAEIENYGDWQEAARTQVFDCMGEPPPSAENYDWKVIAKEQREGYTAMKIAFNLSAWYRVTAYVLVPDGGGKYPAVNVLHDHGGHLFIGKEKMIRPFDEDSAVIKDADKWVADLYDGQYFGDYLAQHGYVAFSIDAPLWGERGRAEGVNRAKYDIIAGNMMMLGGNLCAFMHYDDIASTEFLATLPFVDADRIGAAGCSMGAYRAWMLSALSNIKVACADCWMVTTEAQLSNKYGRAENGGFANSIPVLRNYLDYPDIASLACPKPMLFIAGKQDKLFPIPGVEQAFDVMNSVWKSQNAASVLETYILDQPHECNLEDQKIMLNFMNKHLK